MTQQTQLCDNDGQWQTDWNEEGNDSEWQLQTEVTDRWPLTQLNGRSPEAINYWPQLIRPVTQLWPIVKKAVQWRRWPDPNPMTQWPMTRRDEDRQWTMTDPTQPVGQWRWLMTQTDPVSWWRSPARPRQWPSQPVEPIGRQARQAWARGRTQKASQLTKDPGPMTQWKTNDEPSWRPAHWANDPVTDETDPKPVTQASYWWRTAQLTQ